MKEIIDKIKNIDFKGEYLTWLARYTVPYLPQILLMMVFSISTSLITAELAILSKDIIDSATSGNFVLKTIGVYVMFVAVSMAISAIASVMSIVLDEKFSFGIRKNIYEKIIRSSWPHIKKYHSGDLMTRLTSDASNISNGIIYTLPNIIKLIIELIIMFGILYYYEPVLALMSLLIAPVAGVTCWVLGRKLKKLQVKVLESESKYRSFLQESIANLLIVKAFGNEQYSADKLVELRENRFYWVRKKANMGIISSNIMSVSFQVGYLAAFTLGAFKVADGSITYGTMTLFLSLVGRIQSPIMLLAEQIPKVVSIFASAGRVIEIQEITEENYEPNDMTQEHIGVEVSGVNFGYEEKKNVLEGVSTKIQPGEFVAIIGESGIGKTTLIRLMMAFMEPSQGNIAFYNTCGQKTGASAGARNFMSYVPQGNTLFSGTIRENIRMGKEDATEEEIIESLKIAAAYDFVMELPKGLDTEIGERGHGISEGQAQRIAIARAVIKRAPFLILDEATASLDEKTELAVLEGIRGLTPKPTCILITHRRSVLDYCDREIKIEQRHLQS